MTAIEQYFSVTIQIIKLLHSTWNPAVVLITLYKTVLTPVEDRGEESRRYINDVNETTFLYPTSPIRLELNPKKFNVTFKKSLSYRVKKIIILLSLWMKLMQFFDIELTALRHACFGSSCDRVPESEWCKTKETKDRKQFNSKIEPKHNVSQTKEGQCAPVPAERPHAFY